MKRVIRLCTQYSVLSTRYFVVAVLIFLALPQTVAAHPLGNFTVNRYSRIEVEQDHLRLVYIVDLAEIPAFQELNVVDVDWNGQVDDAERAAYLDRKAIELRDNLRLTVDGQPAPLRLASGELTFPPGQGGLVTFRLKLAFETQKASATGQVGFRDENYADRLGWKEVVARPGDGVRLNSSTVPETDVSDELRAYPDDALLTPLNVTTASLEYAPGAGAAPRPSTTTSTPTTAGSWLDPRTGERLLTELLSARELSLPIALLALLLASVLGAFHALSPGHGKTVVAAYLVGNRGTAAHALFLGLTVTATHTLGVFALGFVTLFAARYVLPEQLYPWLSLFSGLTVVVIGLTLFRSRLRSAFAGGWPLVFSSSSSGAGRQSSALSLESSAVGSSSSRVAPAHDYSAHAPGHSLHRQAHDHAHSSPDHTHVHAHSHHPRDHSHALGHLDHHQSVPIRHDHAPESGHDAHLDHDHHDLGHHHGQHFATHDHFHQHPHSHDHGPAHAHHGHDHDHHHGPGGHSHLPPGADGTPVTWKSLLALGIAGGLLPCPTALVVLLGAIAVNRVGFGLLLVVAFSIGLAGVLTAIGLVLVYAGRFAGSLRLELPALRLLPVASALIISVIGLVITAQALAQTGLGQALRLL